MLQTTALIFALNLFALPMDVQWGDDVAYKATGLFLRTASKAALVETGVAKAVLFRRGGATGWSQAKAADGSPLVLKLEAGRVYVFVVKTNGNGEIVPLDVPATKNPKILFVNAAKGPAATLRLGASADGLEPGWTAFVDAAPGVQTLTWSWPTMPPGTDFYKASSTQPGQPGTTKLLEGHWYVAVVSGSAGQVYDITP